MEKKERDSGLELLRIIGLFLIFWMHGASSYVNNSLSAWLCIVIETIGNVGVPVFILISGYFGIRFKPKKLLQLDLMLIFYCWTGLALRFAWGDAAEYGMEQILSYVLPVIGRNSWYFTCYFALAILRICGKAGEGDLPQDACADVSDLFGYHDISLFRYHTGWRKGNRQYDPVVPDRAVYPPVSG